MPPRNCFFRDDYINGPNAANPEIPIVPLPTPDVDFTVTSHDQKHAVDTVLPQTGCCPQPVGNRFHGQIALLQFYDFSLTGEQVAANCNDVSTGGAPTDFSCQRDCLGDWNNIKSWDPPASSTAPR